MIIGFVVRPAVPADAEELAAVHVATWRETYRGLMRDSLLDDPTLVDRRARSWAERLDPAWEGEPERTVVAEHAGRIVGLAVATADRVRLVYALRDVHGTGVGGALLDAVLDPSRPASLWVAEASSRARAFFAKHGFAADGAERGEAMREVRMVRE